MEKIKLYETYAIDNVITMHDIKDINEAKGDKSEIDGVNIIGVIEGQFFQPDGLSRNKRWYPKALWEKVLASSDVKNRLIGRTMYGEIGHRDTPVEDEILREGYASHIISDLWIDEKGRGMGKAYILNTETGKRLKTYLGAKSKLKVSTRGEGTFVEGQTHDGYPIVDPDTYDLQTVDFVLNPGFLETSANLTVKESLTKNNQVNETTIDKKGEQRMTIDMDTYVRELKEELQALKDENKSLSSQLQIKEKELLEKSLVESSEVKKISEQYAPFKKMGVSAKTINETLKRSQKNLQEEKEKNKKLTDELNAFKEACGSIETIEVAKQMSEKALDTIAEYQKLGSVQDLRKLVQESAKAVVRLQKLEEYKKIGSTEDLKKLKENYTKVLPRLKESTEYRKLGSIEDIKKMAENAEEYAKLVKNTEKLLPKLERCKYLEKNSKRAKRIIEKYMAAVGTTRQAKALAESVKSAKPETKKVNVKEALEMAKKFGCTVESSAKLIKKYGAEKASSLLSESVAKKDTNKVELKESKELVETSQKMDETAEAKSAKDFLKPGMITNSFNPKAFGKKIEAKDLNKLNGEKVEGTNAAHKLINNLKDKCKAKVAECPVKLEKPATQAEAEAEAKKLLK